MKKLLALMLALSLVATFAFTGLTVGAELAGTFVPETSDTDTATDVVDTDVASDVDTDVATDVATDVDTDVATDVETDVATDVETDVATDVETDVATDVETDVATDVETDVATDVETDVATDSEVEVDVVLGDANGDGEVDIIDVALMRSHIVNGTEVANAADVNFDEVVDIIDVVIVRNAIVYGTEIEAPVVDDNTDSDVASDVASDVDSDVASDVDTDVATDVDTDVATDVDTDVDTDVAVNLYTGELVLGNWEGYEQISVTAVEVGDVIRVTVTDAEEGAQVAIQNTSWSAIPGFGEAADVTGDTVDFEVTEENVDIVAGGIIVKGQKATVTSVDLI